MPAGSSPARQTTNDSNSAQRAPRTREGISVDQGLDQAQVNLYAFDAVTLRFQRGEDAMPGTVNIGEAKAQLSHLIARAEAGEDVIIARDGVPAARIVPLERPLGETIALMRRETVASGASLRRRYPRCQGRRPRLMAIVVDVSIAAAWCFPDEQASAAERVLDNLPRLGGVVPGIFPVRDAQRPYRE